MKLDGQQFFHLANALEFLFTELPPEFLKFRIFFRVGDVLIVSPQAIQASVHGLNQIVDMIFASGIFADVFTAFF